ncbi:MAG: dihydrofolate reductase [Bacteroidales bacterium]|nr:dihydrofolate reductase [Candidatus Scybalousia scybalohippi]
MYKGKKVIHLVARDSKGGIGKDNSLMWNIPEDMKFFRESTLGNVCLVGRKTAESFPKPLSRRVVIEVSRQGYSELMCNDSDFLERFIADAYFYTNKLNTDKIFIIGGEMLYNSTFDIADELWITEVSGDFSADKFYHIPEGFHLFEWSEVKLSVNDHFFYFTKYLRNGNVPF